MSAEAIQGLKNYKYKSTGLTWLDEVHQPFWNGALCAAPPFNRARRPTRL